MWVYKVPKGNKSNNRLLLGDHFLQGKTGTRKSRAEEFAKQIPIEILKLFSNEKKIHFSNLNRVCSIHDHYVKRVDSVVRLYDKHKAYK